jgi:hypothetical protein
MDKNFSSVKGAFALIVQSVIEQRFSDTKEPLVFDSNLGSETELYYVNGRINIPVIYNTKSNTLTLVREDCWEDYCKDLMMADYLSKQEMKICYHESSGFEVSIGKDGQQLYFSKEELTTVNFSQIVEILRTEYANDLSDEDEFPLDRPENYSYEDEAADVIFPDYKG